MAPSRKKSRTTTSGPSSTKSGNKTAQAPRAKNSQVGSKAAPRAKNTGRSSRTAARDQADFEQPKAPAPSKASTVSSRGAPTEDKTAAALLLALRSAPVAFADTHANMLSSNDNAAEPGIEATGETDSEEDMGLQEVEDGDGDADARQWHSAFNRNDPSDPEVEEPGFEADGNGEGTEDGEGKGDGDGDEGDELHSIFSELRKASPNWTVGAVDITKDPNILECALDGPLV